MSGAFAGKTVLITGAASGIGRQTAFAFAERGARLVLVDVNSSGLERTALLCSKLGGQVETHVADVASEEAMRSLAARVHEQVPALDVLVNNAGVGVAGSFVGTPLSDWDWALGINVKGVVHGCHFFLPAMIERGRGGHVVNVASVAGLVAAKLMSVYSATKFAVVGLSESLRTELAPHGIHVSTICPGVIDTPITRNTRFSGELAGNSAFKEGVARFYQKRGYGPERVAAAIVRAVEKRQGLVPVSPESWALYYGKRWAPRLVEALMARDVPI
ncbi:MAG TPA: SDR family NAD(P)-dependent oxidoreductase [Polyangiaceae bacterium]|nr:SDR family NAD(P)-dependent oxidoreductase [Polyangiaceae bacterium]